MDNIVEVKKLNYLDFKEFSLEIEKNSYTVVVGGIKSGKTTLLKIMCGIISTRDVCVCNNITLSHDNRDDYIKNFGVVFSVDQNSFIKKSVKDELEYSLNNLCYGKIVIDKKIKKILSELNLYNIYNKNIDDLDSSTKQVLLFIIALLHDPKVLLIDDAFVLLNDKHKKLIYNYLISLKEQSGLTIVHFTSDLTNVINSDYLYLLDNFSIKESGNPLELLIDDQLFYQSGLEVPFMIDLSIKLKMYGLIDKVYLNMEELVDNIWK